MHDQITQALQATQQGELLQRKELALEKIITDNFGKRLSKGILEHGFNTFEFRVSQETGATNILFHGPHAADLRVDVMKLLQKKGCKVKKAKDLSLDVFLSKVTPVSLQELQAHLAKRSNGNGNGHHHKSPEELVRLDSKLRIALETVEEFHSSQLFLGVKNKRSPLIFVGDKQVAVEFNYVNEVELLAVLEATREIFNYTPKIRKGKHKGEEVVLQFVLSAIEIDTIDRRRFRKRSTRIVEGCSPDAITEFVIRKFMRIVPHEIRSEKEAGYSVFRIENEHHVKTILEKAGLYGVVSLRSERDRRCFWVATNQNTEVVFRSSKGSATEIIHRLYKDQGTPIPSDLAVGPMDRKMCNVFVRKVIVEATGLQPEQFQITQPACTSEGNVLYTSVVGVTEAHKNLIRSKYAVIKSRLPLGVEALFQGIRAGAASLFFYFPSREEVVKLMKEGGGVRAAKVKTEPPSHDESLGERHLFDRPSHVRMFLGLSPVEQKQCIEAARISNCDKVLDEIKDKLKAVALIDIENMKSVSVLAIARDLGVVLDLNMVLSKE